MLLLAETATQNTSAEPPDPFDMRGQTCFRRQGLPAEIRLIILEFLVPQAGHGTYQLSSYASVCLEWQAFFEKFTFRTIKFSYTPSGIVTFKSYMNGSRLAVCKEVIFHIPLTRYTCDGCDREEDQATIVKNNTRFTEGLVSLFSVMSSWTLPTGHGIRLELCASSPSDTEHYFHVAENDGQSGGNDQSRDVLAHQQKSRRFSPFGSKQRLVGSLLDFHCPNGEISLPQVPAVSEFSMNRYMFRSLSSSAVRKILETLDGLRHLRYEPWRGIDGDGQEERNRALGAVLLNLPPKVLTVSIWEAQEGWLYTRKRKSGHVRLGWYALRASFDLQTLAISQAVEAGDFFRPFYKKTEISAMPVGVKVWRRLKCLSLTSQIPTRLRGPTETNALLLAASRAAWHMPQLQTMEIWHGAVGKGFLFRYEVLGSATIITIESTWYFQLSQKTLRSWELVASERTRHKLSVTRNIIHPSSLRARTSICARLKLKALLKERRPAS